MFEAKNRLTALLDAVEGGGELVITGRAKARTAAEGLRATSKGQTLGGLTLKELIGEGRR